MNIEITERSKPHCWVVYMDDLAVNFYSLEQANMFVGQLKTCIAAPHVWPHAEGTGDFCTHYASTVDGSGDQVTINAHAATLTDPP
jgi:hypothetical protein